MHAHERKCRKAADNEEWGKWERTRMTGKGARLGHLEEHFIICWTIFLGRICLRPNLPNHSTSTTTPNPSDCLGEIPFLIKENRKMENLPSHWTFSESSEYRLNNGQNTGACRHVRRPCLAYNCGSVFNDNDFLHRDAYLDLHCSVCQRLREHRRGCWLLYFVLDMVCACFTSKLTTPTQPSVPKFILLRLTDLTPRHRRCLECNIFSIRLYRL